MNDKVFVEALGRQVHAKTRTKTDSFRGAAATVSRPSHAVRVPTRMLSAPGSGEGQETTD